MVFLRHGIIRPHRHRPIRLPVRRNTKPQQEVIAEISESNRNHDAGKHSQKQPLENFAPRARRARTRVSHSEERTRFPVNADE